MKIKLIKTYQSVLFENSSHESFTASDYHMDGIAYQRRPKVSFEIQDHGVLVTSDKDCVLVGWNNVAYVQYDLATKDSEKSKDSKELKEQKKR